MGQRQAEESSLCCVFHTASSIAESSTSCPEYEICLTEGQLDLLPMPGDKSDFGESDDIIDAEEYSLHIVSI